ncbi:MAG: FG-GAP repeat protein [Methanomassiliicoccales archaeon]|nr:MAG: FG-GAP repeat protein [Methanomassiliicoccales archaeon]
MKSKRLTHILLISVLASIVFTGGLPIIPANITNNDPIVEIEDFKYNDISLLNENVISFKGTTELNRLGISVSNAGDVNNDGFDDVIIGAPGVEQYGDKGNAYIHLGGYSMNDIPDTILTGEEVGDWFGVSVSAAGDVNNDGFDDVIVGAFTNDAGGYNAGRAYIYFGGNPMDNIPDVIMTGNESEGFFGSCVSDAGDVNDDGFDDVLVVARYANNDVGYYGEGNVTIYLGGDPMDNITDIVISFIPNINTSGSTMIDYASGAGDVNGDGFDDVIVGRPLESGSNKGGRVYLYFGGDPMDNQNDFIMAGEALWDNFGFSVAGAGDVNNDGFDDFIIGGPGYDPQHSFSIANGRTYLFYGGNPLDDVADVIFDAEVIAPNDGFGTSVSGACDINNDGYSDVIVGASHCYEGRTYVFYGGESMDNTSDITLIGEGIWDRFGVSVSSAGDVNKDGYDDFIIGAPVNGSEAYDAGKAYLRISPYVVVNEGDNLDFIGNFTDPDINDMHTIEWNFDDGNTATGTLTPSHAYGDNGVYMPTLTVTDNNGGTGNKHVQVIVKNVPPVADAGDHYYGIVGIPVTIQGSHFDPGCLDTHTYYWDMDGDGIYDDGTGTTLSWTWYVAGTYHVRLIVIDDDGGYDYDTALVTIQPLNQPPVADAGGPYSGNEGSPITFNASLSYDPDGDNLQYRWDFHNDGIWDTGWSSSPYVEHTWGDDYDGEVVLEVTDGQLTDIDTCNVEVLNVDPTVTIESATMDVEIGLRVAGRKFNDVGMTLYEEGIPIGYLSIERMPGSPNAQMAWIPIILDMTKTYSATLTYIPEDPPNIGSNPVWIYIKFEDSSIEKIHHTFNVQQSKKRDSDHWNHVEPWEVDLMAALTGHPFEVTSHITDPGSDDETLTYNYGSQSLTYTYLNNPPNPDPYPSPELSPRDIIDFTSLSYEGPGLLELTVEDDDGGSVTATIELR